MWLITDIGFFSVALQSGDQLLTVRARVKDDLEALAAKTYELTEFTPKIIFALEEDFFWRTQIPPRILASVIAHYITFDLMYSDFEGRIDRVQHERRTIYQDVATELRALDAIDLRRKLKGA
jgi:hypothetical protein